MASSDNIIHEWDAPNEVISCEAIEFRKRWKKTSIRVIICVAMIEILLYLPIYLLISNPSVVELSENLSSLTLPFLFGFPIAICGLLLLYVFLPFLMRRTKHTYRITNAGLEAQQNWELIKYPWKNIKGYWISQHKSLPQYSVLTFIYRNKKCSVFLPERDFAQNITGTMAQLSTPVQPSQYERIRLTSKQCIFLCLLTLLYSSLSLACFKFPDIIGSFALITLLFGPGTLGLFLCYKKKLFTKSELKGYALMINLIASYLVLFSGVLMRLILIVTNL